MVGLMVGHLVALTVGYLVESLAVPMVGCLDSK